MMTLKKPRSDGRNLGSAIWKSQTAPTRDDYDAQKARSFLQEPQIKSVQRKNSSRCAYPPVRPPTKEGL